MTLNSQQEAAIREVKKFIDSTPLQRRSIPELVSRSGLSLDKLTEGFKELYGRETIYNYQVKQSMLKAAELLQQGVMIKSVALAAGYSSQGNFTRAFFSVFKVVPSQYQSAARQQ